MLRHFRVRLRHTQPLQCHGSLPPMSSRLFSVRIAVSAPACVRRRRFWAAGWRIKWSDIHRQWCARDHAYRLSVRAALCGSHLVGCRHWRGGHRLVSKNNVSMCKMAAAGHVVGHRATGARNASHRALACVPVASIEWVGSFWELVYELGLLLSQRFGFGDVKWTARRNFGWRLTGSVELRLCFEARESCAHCEG